MMLPCIEPTSTSGEGGLAKIEDESEKPQHYAASSKKLFSGQWHGSSMTVALKSLLDCGITVVEYVSQVLYRRGYAEVLSTPEWIVPDEQVSLASQILIDNGFPLVKHSKRIGMEYWETRCSIHGLDGLGNSLAYILPLSLVGFTLEDTVQVPSTFDEDIQLLSAKPPYYMLPLIKVLKRMPLADCSRWRIAKSLAAFISTYMLNDGPANMPWEQREALRRESDEDYGKRVDEAVRVMKTWDWGNTVDRYLALAENVVRDASFIDKLMDDTEPQEALTHPESQC
ncbi:hypothetical protein N7455_003539 [Penicillium solitum]|uniref:uncharacterized protein n=1 Tax=Penicillium solitum TaxID=60172 RepID=UPI0032C40844|nr:hypothetical protein N7536_003968 [Penicillium majusculum]KAJ5880074.1 hypothetical protein N7455_003539 [Penicillium solitum]